VSDDQLPVGWRWESVEFTFPPITNSHETSLENPIPTGIPWEFPYYAHLWILNAAWNKGGEAYGRRLGGSN